MARFHSFTRPKESIPTMAWVESLAPGVFLVRARSAGQSYYSPKKKIYKHTRELDQLLLGHGLPGQVLKKKLFWLNGACACPMPMPDLFCSSQCCSPIHTLLHHSWIVIMTCDMWLIELRGDANLLNGVTMRQVQSYPHEYMWIIWPIDIHHSLHCLSVSSQNQCLVFCFCRYKSCTIEPREQTTRKQLKCSQAERREIVWRFPGPGFTWYQHERTPKKVQPLHWWVLIKVFKVTSLSILCCLCSLQHVTTPSSGPTSSH